MYPYLSVRVVGVPGSSERFLPSQIPHDKVYVVPNHLFHIATDCWGGVNHFVHQELVQNGSLAGIVQTDQADLVFWAK